MVFLSFKGLEFINRQRVRLVDPAQWATSPLDKSPAREHHEFFLINTEVFFMRKGRRKTLMSKYFKRGVDLPTSSTNFPSQILKIFMILMMMRKRMMFISKGKGGREVICLPAPGILPKKTENIFIDRD